jgi:imidazolonepropionase-like amidohydrolase
MRFRRSMCFCWRLIFAAVSVCGRPIPATQTTAFVDVTVVPMDTERFLVHQTVLVRDGRIAEIGPTSTVKLPAGCTILDGRNRYLIPGLVDSHAHLFGPGAKPGDLELQKRVLTLMMANGVTTILNMWGAPETLKLRDAVARGEMEGPRVYTTGPFIEEAHNYTLGGFVDSPTIHTPEEARREVIAQKKAGYDFIKIHGGLPAETYRALMETARAEGIRVIGHLPSNLGIEAAFEEHQAMIAHAEEYLYSYFEFHREPPKDPEEIDRMVREVAARTKEAGVWVTPTLYVFHQIIPQVLDIQTVMARPELKYMPGDVLETWRPPNNPYAKRWKAENTVAFEAQFKIMQRLVRGLREAGVPLLAGTDSFVPCVVPGFAMTDELQELVDAGLTTYQALQAATSNAAQFLNGSKEFGTITVGKRADLVLLDENPLKDVRNVSRREGVMLNGKWHSEADLKEQLRKLAAGASY